MQKQRETGGVQMEQKKSHSTIRNPDGPATPQRNSQKEPQWNSLKIPFGNPTKVPDKG